MSIELLKNNSTDHLVATLKTLLSAASVLPLAGVFQELIGAYIPKQRLDRVVDFIERLNSSLEELRLDVETLKAKLQQSAELFEEGMRQASTTDSVMRRSYLARLISHGVQGSEQTRIYASHMLKLLEQMSDLDVLTLAGQAGFGDVEFRRAATGRISSGSAEDLRATMRLHKGVIARLVGLGLMAEFEEVINAPRNVRYAQPAAERETRISLTVTDTGSEFLAFLDESDLPAGE